MREEFISQIIRIPRRLVFVIEDICNDEMPTSDIITTFIMAYFEIRDNYDLDPIETEFLRTYMYSVETLLFELVESLCEYTEPGMTQAEKDEQAKYEDELTETIRDIIHEITTNKEGLLHWLLETLGSVLDDYIDFGYSFYNVQQFMQGNNLIELTLSRTT